MPHALARRRARLERQRLALMERLSAYTDAQCAFQPDPASWSLADVVLHLILVEEALVQHGRAQTATRPPWVRFRARLRERIVVAALGRDLRIQAPSPAVLPQAHLPLDALAVRWAAARSGLWAYLAELRPPLWARTAFRHPRTGWVTAMGGLRIIEAHCDHHLRQVERILAAEGFPG